MESPSGADVVVEDTEDEWYTRDGFARSGTFSARTWHKDLVLSAEVLYNGIFSRHCHRQFCQIPWKSYRILAKRHWVGGAVYLYWKQFQRLIHAK